MTGEGWSILDWFACPVPLHAWQVQEHGEAGCTFNQRADRQTTRSGNEVPLPMTRNRPVCSPVADPCRAVADHRRIGEEGLAAIVRVSAQ